MNVDSTEAALTGTTDRDNRQGGGGRLRAKVSVLVKRPRRSAPERHRQTLKSASSVIRTGQRLGIDMASAFQRHFDMSDVCSSKNANTKVSCDCGSSIESKCVVADTEAITFALAVAAQREI